MGFFSDLKEDLSQAVNELMPEESLEEDAQASEGMEFGDIDKMLEHLDDIALPEEESEGDLSVTLPEEPMEELSAETPESFAGYVPETFAEQTFTEEAETTADTEEPEADLEDALKAAFSEPEPEEAEELETEEEISLESMENSNMKGENEVEETMNVRVATDENATITAGMRIAGDVSSEGSLELIGYVKGNIDILGKLSITGRIDGNSSAAEIFAEGARINGEVSSEGAVKIGASSVIIGNITATSAVIAGAVKGDIDVQGPVILDTTAVVMGNIKSKSVQINNGAVIEGMCSQCYADVNPVAFFENIQ